MSDIYNFSFFSNFIFVLTKIKITGIVKNQDAMDQPLFHINRKRNSYCIDDFYCLQAILIMLQYFIYK